MRQDLAGLTSVNRLEAPVLVVTTLVAADAKTDFLANEGESDVTSGYDGKQKNSEQESLWGRIIGHQWPVAKLRVSTWETRLAE
ncbi:hypothetical protein ASD00_32685 [Ensifer sp. Root31]|uniref:hypothetical protein n=1 Tax=Ensifer sp. Root31 TaxID=1736512 RepID=UPI000709508F|nr:hypothetical protein [Ensifer sp. Root31]KQU85446.1 hypothetical protein ASD00_32685 [Ensifer sp. Root31]